HFTICYAQMEDLSNFAFQVTMSFIQASRTDVGGIFFRTGEDSTGFVHGYFLDLDQYRGYNLGVSQSPSSGKSLATGFNSAINAGLNQTNVLTVIAQGASLHVYVNKQLVANVSDSTFTTGALVLYASDVGSPADIAFSNARIWKL